jgi:hypothetical protein
MIKWYREGKFPVEKLVKFYPVRNQAISNRFADGDTGKRLSAGY